MHLQKHCRENKDSCSEVAIYTISRKPTNKRNRKKKENESHEHALVYWDASSGP